MKLLFLIVSLISAFTANCRRSDGEPEERHVDSKLLQQVNGKTLFVASEPEVQDSSDVEVQLNKEEVRQNERKPRGSKCAANAVCTILGGTCVNNASLCTGRLVSDACKGKKSKCCIIEHVSQCVNETTMKDTIKDGNENIIGALETKIQKLETDLQSMKTNLTRSIKGCPEGFFMITGPINQCFKYFTDKERTWTEAQSKCQSEGLVLAKPYDPLALRIFIVTRHGSNRAFAWLDATGDGTNFIWVRDGAVMTSSYRYWYPSQPGTAVATTNCLYLRATESYWKQYPDQPYTSGSCTSGFRALCELVM